MIKHHTIVFGAGLGLLVGMVMFAAGLALRGSGSSVLGGPFLLLHAPALAIVARSHAAAYNWNSPAGLSQLCAAFLVYWTLLGTLAGLGGRAFLNRQYPFSPAVARH